MVVVGCCSLLFVFQVICLHMGDSFSAHAGKILTFPFVHKGAGLSHKPLLLGAPETVFEWFVATLLG